VTFSTQRANLSRADHMSRGVLAFGRVMVIALSEVSATVGLIVVFFVIFPALITGLIVFALAQVFGERGENQAYLARRRTHRP
jgi:hypothetical protein